MPSRLPPHLLYASVDSDDSVDRVSDVPTPPSSSEHDRGEEMQGAGKSRKRHVQCNELGVRDTHMDAEGLCQHIRREAATLRQEINIAKEILRDTFLTDARFTYWDRTRERLQLRLQELSEGESCEQCLTPTSGNAETPKALATDFHRPNPVGKKPGRLTTVPAVPKAKSAAPGSGGGRKLWVDNLSPTMNWFRLRGVFEPFGEITDFSLRFDREEQGSTRSGHIEFANSKDAATAKTAMQAHVIDGYPLRIKCSSPLWPDQTSHAVKKEQVESSYIHGSRDPKSSQQTWNDNTPINIQWKVIPKENTPCSKAQQDVDARSSQDQILRSRMGTPVSQQDGDQGQWHLPIQKNDQVHSHEIPASAVDWNADRLEERGARGAAAVFSRPQNLSTAPPRSRRQEKMKAESDDEALAGGSWRTPVDQAAHFPNALGARQSQLETTHQDRLFTQKCGECGLVQALFVDEDNDFVCCECGETLGAITKSHKEHTSDTEEQINLPVPSFVSDSCSVRENGVFPEKPSKRNNTASPAKHVINKYFRWTEEQDQELLFFRIRSPPEPWATIAKTLGKTSRACKDRYKIIEAERGLSKTSKQQKKNLAKQNVTKAEKSEQPAPKLTKKEKKTLKKATSPRLTDAAVDSESEGNPWAYKEDSRHQHRVQNTVSDCWGRSGPRDACGNYKEWIDDNMASFGLCCNANVEEDRNSGEKEPDAKEFQRWISETYASSEPTPKFWPESTEHDRNSIQQTGLSPEWYGNDYRASNRATPEPAVPAPRPYNVTYWATVECDGREVHIPIDGSNVSGPDKIILDGPAKTVWEWVQEKGLGDKVGLRDAFDLAKDMTFGEEQAKVEQAQEKEEKIAQPWESPSCTISLSPSMLSPQLRDWGRGVPRTPAPSLQGMRDGPFGEFLPQRAEW